MEENKMMLSEEDYELLNKGLLGTFLEGAKEGLVEGTKEGVITAMKLDPEMKDFYITVSLWGLYYKTIIKHFISKHII